MNVRRQLFPHPVQEYHRDDHADEGHHITGGGELGEEMAQVRTRLSEKVTEKT